MSFGHRRLLLFDEKSTGVVLLEKKSDCNSCLLNRDCRDECKEQSDEAVHLAFPPPPPLFPSRNGSSNSNMPTILILMLCVLGAAFAFLCYLTILKRYRSNLMSSSRRRRRRDTDTEAPVGDGNGNGNGNGREDFMDENLGPMMINPIWYINTVGLQQSVIDSISVFKYKKGEGLIESADCSVCLSEFQEDERLRLLPKCSHAFHIDCIDMWLRSHKNCPLCRAPIVRESIPEAEEESVLVNNSNNNNNSGSLENTSAADDDDDEDNDAEVERNQPEIGVENINSTTDSISTTGVNKRNDGFRVLSDLSDHHHHHRSVRNTREEELQATVVRRSISMDAASASVIYTAVAKISPVMQEEEEGCSKLQESELKQPTSDKVTKQRVGKELIIHKSRKSFSFGRTLQKMPIRMKRSFSSSSSSNSKSSLPRNRNSKSQELIQSF